MSGGKAFWLILGVLVFGIRSLESLNPTDIYKLLATPPPLFNLYICLLPTVMKHSLIVEIKLIEQQLLLI